MIPKRKTTTDMPERLAKFDPANWGTVLEWAAARRGHLAPLARTHPARWIDSVSESHRVVAAVLRRGELD
ncbi:MAG: hypothetical protein U1D68_10630 [Arthrobacter sp.]|nr:hypothetical protein [Arthrobacter sp.]MDZ4351358.1 hypothetical protein [Arthrobacter sp.]